MIRNPAVSPRVIGRPTRAVIGRWSLSSRQQFGARVRGASRDLTVGAAGLASVPDPSIWTTSDQPGEQKCPLNKECSVVLMIGCRAASVATTTVGVHVRGGGSCQDQTGLRPAGAWLAATESTGRPARGAGKPLRRGERRPADESSCELGWTDLQEMADGSGWSASTLLIALRKNYGFRGAPG